MEDFGIIAMMFIFAGFLWFLVYTMDRNESRRTYYEYRDVKKERRKELDKD